MAAELAEAWFFAFVLLAGLGAGSLALLWIGRLLGRRWLTPLDDELRPAASTLPLVLLIGVPLAFGLEALARSWAVPDRLAPWFDPQFLALRTLFYLGSWSLLWLFVARRGGGMRAAALGLVLLAPTAALAGADWVLARGPFWWSSLFGFAFAVSQLAPALALAFLANRLQREPVDLAQDRSLVSALMTLVLAAAWLWFVQFLAAWMANLPEEAAWYLARLEGGRWIPLALAGGAVAAALLLLLQRHRSRFFVDAAAALILAGHALHTLWLLRPAPITAPNPVDLVALIPFALWTAAFWAAVRRQDRQSGRPGSSQRGRSGGTSGGHSVASAERSE